MSSTNKTTNLKLNKWIGTDRSAREDFNNDNDLIDKFAGEVAESLKDLRNEVTQLSNPNLLINGDFQVWQRGTNFLNVNTYAKYTADRWRIDVNNGSVASVEKHDEGLKYTVVTNSDFPPLLVQEIEISSNMRGKKISFSASFGEVSGNFVINLQHYTNGIHTPTYSNYIATNGTYMVTAEIPSNVEKLYVVICSNSTTTNGSYFIIKNAKLEYGSQATPFVPRLYGEELAICRRYYQQVNQSPYYSTLGYGVVTGSQEAMILMPINTPLRVTPTITVTRKDDIESLVVQAYNSVNGSGVNYLIDNIYIDGNLVTTNSISLRVTIKGTMAIGNVAKLVIGNVATTVTLDSEIY